MSHIPEHGLVLDYSLEDNMVPSASLSEFTDKAGFLRRRNIRHLREKLIDQYDVRSGRGPITIARSMSAATSRRPSSPLRSTGSGAARRPVQPTAVWTSAPSSTSTASSSQQRDEGKAVLLVSLSWTRSWTCPTASS